jgi:hypothetical protein
MDFKFFKLLCLLALVVAQAGCATTKETYDDTPSALEQSPSHDDSHGWGANLQQAH